ncbi:MAG: hypothetical protein E7D27_15050 [Clostridium celatum]|nr:hypothetical protein [Clostridium celatum]
MKLNKILIRCDGKDIVINTIREVADIARLLEFNIRLDILILNKRSLEDEGFKNEISIKPRAVTLIKNINMELNETIEMMQSSDYKERFKAEYLQVKNRYDKLDEMTVKYEAGTLNFTPSCSLELLKEQKKHMGNYIRCLKLRAEIEGIDLN